MNEIDKWSNILYFVGLEMAQKVPLDVFRQVFVLFDKFLYLIFAKNTLTSFISLNYISVT